MHGGAVEAVALDARSTSNSTSTSTSAAGAPADGATAANSSAEAHRDDDALSETERFVSKVMHRLDAHGVTDTEGLRALDPTVVDLAPLPIRGLADAIEGARAQVSGRPQLRRTRDRLVVPGADLEIDVDMESALDGTVYLWGALADGDYHAKVSWAPPGSAVDADVFVRFWRWLNQVRADAAEAGRTVACYCWFRGAESGALRAGAQAALDLLGVDHCEAVERFLAGPEFVDLYEVFTRQLVTGTSAGLKTVASSAGFTWRDEDPNGAASMAWHARAVGAAISSPTAAPSTERDDARQRLLAYNEDDVRATAAVRAWMRTTLGGTSA